MEGASSLLVFVFVVLLLARSSLANCPTSASSLLAPLTASLISSTTASASAMITLGSAIPPCGLAATLTGDCDWSAMEGSMIGFLLEETTDE